MNSRSIIHLTGSGQFCHNIRINKQNNRIVEYVMKQPNSIVHKLVDLVTSSPRH